MCRCPESFENGAIFARRSTRWPRRCGGRGGGRLWSGSFPSTSALLPPSALIPRCASMRVVPVPVLSDNYAYLVIDRMGEAVAVDPAEPDKVRGAGRDLRKSPAQLCSVPRSAGWWDAGQEQGGTLCDALPRCAVLHSCPGRRRRCCGPPSSSALGCRPCSRPTATSGSARGPAQAGTELLRCAALRLGPGPAGW